MRSKDLSNRNDEKTFLTANQYVVVVCRDHWVRESRQEFTDPWEAVAALEKDKRALLYAKTEPGRTATFGYHDAERLTRVLLEEVAKRRG